MAIKDTNKRIFITIDKELLKEIEELAKQDDRTVSNYITRLLKEQINRK